MGEPQLEHEGAPQSLLEAMACARAIVATAVGGIPHLLNAGSDPPAGILVPPFRPDELASNIMMLAKNDELRNRLGQRALERVQQFSFDREWSQYVDLYSAG